MPGLLGAPAAPELQRPPLFVELMEARTSNKRTRGDEAGGENHDFNVLCAS